MDSWSSARDWRQAVAMANADRLLICDGALAIPHSVLIGVARDDQQNQLLVGSRPVAGDFRTAAALRVVDLSSQWLLGSSASPVRSAVLLVDSAVFQQADLESLPTDSLAAAVALLRADGADIPESTWGSVASANRAPANRAPAKSVPGKGTSAPPLTLRTLAGVWLQTVRAWWCLLKFPGRGHGPAGPRDVSLGWWAWPVLLSVALLTLSVNLRYPLFEPDEARNAQLAINIVETGEWMALELGGEPYWDKPPLVHWMIAGCYRLFGINEFSTRLPGNLAALALVACLFGLGRRFVGARAAWLAALGLVLSCGFTVCGRYVTMDSALALSATLTLWGGYFACRGPIFSYRWWLLSAIAGGCGLLIKGPIVAVLTLPVLIACHVLEGNRSLWSLRRWLVYLSVVALIAGPWYLATGWVQPEFLVYFFWRHNVVRFSDAFNHDEPWWFYLPVLFVVLFPASYLLPTLARAIGSNRPYFRHLRTAEVGFLVLSAVWVIGFFSLSESKLPTYVLPAFPPLALLLGFVLDRFVLTPDSLAAVNHWVRWIPCRASRLLLGLFLVSLPVYGFWLAAPTWLEWLGIGVMTLLMGLGTWWAGSALRPRSAAWASFALVALLWLLWSNATILPSVSSYRSVHQAMRAVRGRPEFADVPLVFYCHESYGADLWLDGEGCPEFEDEDRHRLREFLIRERKVLLVSRQEPLAIVGESLPWPLTITKVPGARHLYLCAERDPASHAPQVAERYRPSEVILR